MKSQPDIRKIKGCYYIKRTYHQYWLRRREEERDNYKKQLDDLKSAFKWLMEHC